ncbi:MAG: glycosyltransferase [Pseudomonadales bacterium]
MNILQIHSSDHQGGGGGTIAMERLHLGLRDRGVQSRIMAGRTTTKSQDSRAVPRNFASNKLEGLLGRVSREFGLNDVNYLSSFRVRSTNFYRQADLVHIHGTHGFFNYLALPGLTRDKPALFTLHDMWPMTGHCSQSIGCERWATGCGACPHLDAHPAVKRDNTALEWRLKERAYKRSQLSFITVSGWLTKMAEKGLLAPYPVHHIPNGIDTSIYEPIDPQKCREALGIGDARYVIIFVALALGDKNKGGDIVAKALTSLPEEMKRETCLIVFGDGGKALSEQLGMRALDLGYVRHDRLKAIAYAAADVCLFPTRAEAFGLVVAESMACATPVLSSNVSAIPELVQEGVTGRLAEPGNGEQFANLLQEMLEDTAGRERMAQASRELIVADYNLDQIVERHIDLYREILK